MRSHVDLTLWVLTTFVQAFVVCLFVMQRLFRHFLLLNLYLLLSVMSSLGTNAIDSHFGLTPVECYYFYWFMDALLETFLFFSVCQLSAHVVGDKMPQGNMVWLGLGVFVATAWLSFSVASSSSGIGEANNFTSELSRNISLVSCLAITALWIWKVHNNTNDWTANRLVKVLSVYFCCFS